MSRQKIDKIIGECATPGVIKFAWQNYVKEQISNELGEEIPYSYRDGQIRLGWEIALQKLVNLEIEKRKSEEERI